MTDQQFAPLPTRPSAAPWDSPRVNRDEPIGLVLRVKTAQHIAQWCLQHAPEEACGLVVAHAGDGRTRFIPIPNTHSQPEHHYRFDANAYLTQWALLAQSGEHILGIVHSHPNGPARPSAEDQEVFPIDAPGHYLIMALRKDIDQYRSHSLTSWRMTAPDDQGLSVFQREQVLFT